MDGRHPTGMRGVARALASREFWSFRAINALFGALLTVGTGIAQFAVGDSYRDEVVRLSEQSRDMDEQLKRIDETEATLASFSATSFSLQQIGILLVLLGNMLADFFAARSRPAP